MKSFAISRVVPSTQTGYVDVHVTYDGGGTVFTFPENWPKSTILAQVRNELREITATPEAQKRLAGLVGSYTL